MLALVKDGVVHFIPLQAVHFKLIRTVQIILIYPVHLKVIWAVHLNRCNQLFITSLNALSIDGTISDVLSMAKVVIFRNTPISFYDNPTSKNRVK